MPMEPGARLRQENLASTLRARPTPQMPAPAPPGPQLPPHGVLAHAAKENAFPNSSIAGKISDKVYAGKDILPKDYGSGLISGLWS